MARDDVLVLHSIATKLLALETRDVAESIAARNEQRRLDLARDRGMVRFLRDWVAESGREFLVGSRSRRELVNACMTDVEARALRQVLAPSGTALTRALTRGAIRTEREFHAVRAWIDELEADDQRSEELARAYALVEAFESMQR